MKQKSKSHIVITPLPHRKRGGKGGAEIPSPSTLSVGERVRERGSRIRSFVRRDSRMTGAQRQAFTALWPRYGLNAEVGVLDYHAIFARSAPRILEIGFGSGQSLLAVAQQFPDEDFIGIEIYKPGIGALLLGMQLLNVYNIRVFCADAVDVLERCIPEASLDRIQLFFPDPWPKRRHHKRRLIQPDFVSLMVSKLKQHGVLHLATDWQDYAVQMLRVLSENASLVNLASAQHYAQRSPYRPLLTKFEQRGEKAGRQIWELEFSKMG